VAPVRVPGRNHSTVKKRLGYNTVTIDLSSVFSEQSLHVNLLI